MKPLVTKPSVWMSSLPLMITDDFECFHDFYLLSVRWMKLWEQRRNQIKERLPSCPFQRVLSRDRGALPSPSHPECGPALVTTAAVLSSTSGWCLTRPWAPSILGWLLKGQWSVMCLWLETKYRMLTDGRAGEKTGWSLVLGFQALEFVSGVAFGLLARCLCGLP